MGIPVGRGRKRRKKGRREGREKGRRKRVVERVLEPPVRVGGWIYTPCLVGFGGGYDPGAVPGL